MKDKALRHSILIVAKSYLTRGDVMGTAVHKLLMGILDGAEVMDRVIANQEKEKKK